MSLILEALRKSEAERRRGSTPDVAMELPPVAVARARATPAWLLPAVLLGAIALLAAWWWSQRDAATPGDAASDIASQAAAPRIAAPTPPTPASRAAPAVVAAAPPAPPPSAAAPQQPVAVEPAAPPAPTPAPNPTPVERPADIDATALPPVKLSMHLWDEAPGKRFVILDGQRMAEGERNGEVAVVAIERDGVVIERNGQRARVPLP